MFRLGLCVLTVLGYSLSQINEDLYELNIIHFNDFHAHFDEVSPQGGPCAPEQDPCIGGLARLTTAINEAREAEPDSLVLNGGDTFQGTIWYNFLRWNVSQHFMNMLPHDAHVLGNHEFDHGVDGLVPYLERLNAPMLGANVNTTLEPTMTPYIKNHVIVERKGRKIGIIGILLETFSAPIGQVIMEDGLEAVNREAALLTEQEVDIIILLTHVGFDRDRQLAALVSPDIDIIVGAHSHTLLFTGETPSGDNPMSDYPTVVTRDDGHRIPIVQASCYTRYLGNIKFFIDNEGKVQGWEGQPIYLGTSIIPDPQMVELLDPWREEVDAIGKEVLGRSLITLNRGWCYRRECNMGSWACDGFLEEAQKFAKLVNVTTTDLHINATMEKILNREVKRDKTTTNSSQLMPRATGTNWNEAHVCMINAGGLRVQINPGAPFDHVLSDVKQECGLRWSTLRRNLFTRDLKTPKFPDIPDEKSGDTALGKYLGDFYHVSMLPRGKPGIPVCLLAAVFFTISEVTTEALLMAMPFENYVQVYDLKGEYLLEALEFSVGTSQTTPGDFYSGRMLQIGGMRNTYNGSAPIGSRVTASIRCIECDVPVYLPLDPEKTYRVVTQNYIGDGGGGYSMLSEHRENLVNLDVDYVMLQRYMRRQQDVFQDLDGRINIVW